MERAGTFTFISSFALLITETEIMGFTAYVEFFSGRIVEGGQRGNEYCLVCKKSGDGEVRGRSMRALLPERRGWGVRREKYIRIV